MNCLSHLCLLKHFICFWFEASCTYERKLLKLRSWFYISIIFNLLIIPICRLSAQYPSTSTHLALTLHHWQANNSDHTQFYSVALLCLLKLLQIHTQANAHLSATTTATSSRKTVTTACTMHRIAKRKKQLTRHAYIIPTIVPWLVCTRSRNSRTNNTHWRYCYLCSMCEMHSCRACFSVLYTGISVQIKETFGSK